LTPIINKGSRQKEQEIIMAKPAGGPKAPQGKKDWDEDD